MLWDYKIHADAYPSLKKIGPSDAAKVRAYLDKRIKGCVDPGPSANPSGASLKACGAIASRASASSAASKTTLPLLWCWRQATAPSFTRIDACGVLTADDADRHG